MCICMTDIIHGNKKRERLATVEEHTLDVTGFLSLVEAGAQLMPSAAVT